MDHQHGSEHPLIDQMNEMGKLQQTAVLLLYPGMTALDLTGPQYVFASTMGMKVHLLAKTADPITTDTGLVIQPAGTFEQCPDDISVFFVPGGTTGTLAAIRDDETLAFVKACGERAEYVTSVCTGSLILAAAGLLDGYHATSHWMTLELLRCAGANPVNQRVVIDRNRVTGAGVTAGMDFAFTLLEQLRGSAYAAGVQLLAEYDPKPPMLSGSPEQADASVVRMLQEMMLPFIQEAEQTLRMVRSNG
jgi:cyclohexyl-isocyanide hydratase